MNKFRLWLLAHGLEFEGGRQQWFTPRFFRRFSVCVNHRYITFDIGIDVSRGVFRDELNISHQDLAAQQARWDEEDQQQYQEGKR